LLATCHVPATHSFRVRPSPRTQHRLVQQTPDQTDTCSGSVDATVADMFGLKDRAAAPIPPRPVPQRSVRPRPGRVADIYVNPR
jgi:hypothetical protein